MFDTVVRVEIEGNIFIPFKSRRFKNNAVNPDDFMDVSDNDRLSEAMRLLRAKNAREYLLADLMNSEYELIGVRVTYYGIILGLRLAIVETLGNLNRYDNMHDIATFLVNCMDIGQLRITNIYTQRIR